MGICEGIGDHTFGPLQRLVFARLVGGHVAVRGFKILWHDVGTSKFIDELADAAPADGPVKTLIDGLADSDCEFAIQYIAYTYCTRIETNRYARGPCSAKAGLSCLAQDWA